MGLMLPSGSQPSFGPGAPAIFLRHPHLTESLWLLMGGAPTSGELVEVIRAALQDFRPECLSHSFGQSLN